MEAFLVEAEDGYQRQQEIARVTERVMLDDDLFRSAIDGDEADIALELFRALTGPGDMAEQYFAAEAVLLRRARHFAESVVEAA